MIRAGVGGSMGQGGAQMNHETQESVCETSESLRSMRSTREPCTVGPVTLSDSANNGQRMGQRQLCSDYNDRAPRSWSSTRLNWIL
jgi:hypothetical protein